MHPKPQEPTARTPTPNGDSNTETIKVTSFNVEGCRTNASYLQTLQSKTSIICLQEHFLWDFQSNELKLILPDYDNFVRCHDTSDPLTGSKIPKGQAGVAILWPRAWSPYVKSLPDGNNRVVAVSFNARKKICLVNVYMPTNNPSVNSSEQYLECLDIIHNIMEKYQHDHEIILCGDLNGTLLPPREYNKHDALLQNFISEHGLQRHNNSDKPTFIHHNGTSRSQIDYVLCPNKDLLVKFSISDIDPINMSAHVPVTANLSIEPVNSQTVTQKCGPKQSKHILLWDQADPESFCSTVANQLHENYTMNSADASAKVLCSVDYLTESAASSVPSKVTKLKGPKWKASPAARQLQNQCKLEYKHWTSSGRPQTGPMIEKVRQSKRDLRSRIRQEKCMDRKNLYNELMAKPTSKLFYRLIHRNRSGTSSTTACIRHNDKDIFSSAAQRQCFAQYYEDLSVPKNDGYDDEFMELTKIRHNLINEMYADQEFSLSPISSEEVENAIGKLNPGKSPDEYKMSSEHLKYSKTVVGKYIADAFNSVLRERKVPELFKSGILTPVLKKGKDPTKVDNYRGITVTAVLGKLFEYVILERISISQSDLQYGFTKGLSPTMASLIISEAKTEVDLNRSTLYLATLDSQKAFDVVDHLILMDKLYYQNIQPDLWLIIKNMYDGLTSRVKWVNELSSSFKIGQGVRQGGVLSTHFYKAYINDLLMELEQSKTGLYLGSTYVGSPCCADDIALLADNSDELQVMLNVASRYSVQHRYNIHPVKSKVITQVNHLKSNTTSWKIGRNITDIKDKTEHLGLTRSSKKENNINIDERISLARRTLYSLMSTGVHGSNGLNPKVCYKIYQVYVIPRLLYGLEVLPLTTANIDCLQRFHQNSLRRFQSLPPRTAIGVLHLLLGAMPIAAELHKRQLSLLYSVLSCDNAPMNLLISRQSLTDTHGKSFFSRVSAILSNYGLPSIHTLQTALPQKAEWKKLSNSAIREFWTQSFREDLESKTTVKYVNIASLEIGTVHQTWDSLESSVSEVRKGITKARMLTGTYYLQANKHKFSNCGIVPTCQLCHLEDEDIIHVITRCPALEEVRRIYIPRIKFELQKYQDPGTPQFNPNTREKLTQIILDSNWLPVKINDANIQRINRLTTELCYKLHLERSQLLRT
ncbi:MAG: reverse transcriptase family protein [Sedimenticola sp.]